MHTTPEHRRRVNVNPVTAEGAECGLFIGLPRS
jgi:hypothetical protein